MKHLNINIKVISIFLLCTYFAFAQNGINYKAVIKDDLGNILDNESVELQLSILQGLSQLNVYEEVHTVTTDDNGIIIVNIGEGSILSGSFSDIKWGNFEHFLNVKIDIGNGFVTMETTAFEAVPYAKFSEKTNLPFITDQGSYTSTNNRNTWVDTGLEVPISQAGNYFIDYRISLFSLVGNTISLSSDFTLNIQIVTTQNNSTTVLKQFFYNPLQVLLPNGGTTYLWRNPEILSDSTIDYLEEGSHLSIRVKVSDSPTGSITSNYAISRQKLNLFKLSN